MILIVIMLVKTGDNRRPSNRLETLTFFGVTVVPWIVLFWLMWPHR